MEKLLTTTFSLSMLLICLPLFTKKLKTTPPKMVKTAFILSLVPCMALTMTEKQTLYITLTHMTLEMMETPLTINLNKNSMLFLPVALFVTWTIMQFSTWYMKEESKNKFHKLLLLFLVSMMILATSGNLLQLIVGWEGVGIMSFLLINWWSERAAANSSALQAVIYNRIGDIGIILTMIIILLNFGTWDMATILTIKSSNVLLTLSLSMAAAGKSAQFLMHMWLPAAMEGPTPVSSLLHSSTMVIAGIYLLAQFHPIMNTPMISTIATTLGATTATYAALSALAQNDIKKIIAFSTLSQLGLMMLAIGLNNADLAMFHLLTHATFKSTLFLCSGSIIHNTQDEQDSRKTSCINTTLPLTTTILMINGLTLAGVPFLSGFYSKDLIIESLAKTNNAWSLAATLMTTTMTSAYTTRMLFLTMKKFSSGKPSMEQNEKPNKQTAPLMELTALAITVGTMISTIIPTMPETLETNIKIAPIIAIITGIMLATKILGKNTKKTQWTFANQSSFFDLLHRMLPKKTFSSSNKKSTQLTDLLWLHGIGPILTDKISLITTNMISLQHGMMKSYIGVFALALVSMFLIKQF